MEVELRAALVADEETTETREEHVDAETRERVELRSKARLVNYMLAAAQGRIVGGAERELQEAAGISDAGVPLELFDVVDDQQVEHRADQASVAPSTVGVNMDVVRPRIYARSVLPRVGVTMPRVQSGTFAVPTITAGLTAGAVAAGAAKDSTAATINAQTTTPHRVTGRLSIRIEDVAAIGTDSFEAALRTNLQLVMSDQLDQLGLTGDGQGANPHGLLPQLTDPADPTNVVTWEAFVAAVAGGIDGGPWAETMREIAMVVNAETMRTAEVTFQAGTGTDTPGELSAAAYLRDRSRGFFASRRMPATVSTIAQAIRYRGGTMGLDGVNAMSTATLPVWTEIGIDDIYSDSASGIRHFTMHSLIGDVVITQADAYERVDLKISS